MDDQFQKLYSDTAFMISEGKTITFTFDNEEQSHLHGKYNRSIMDAGYQSIISSFIIKCSLYLIVFLYIISIFAFKNSIIVNRIFLFILFLWLLYTIYILFYTQYLGIVNDNLEKQVFKTIPYKMEY